MRIPRFIFCTFALAMAHAVPALAQDITVTDLEGRSVVVAQPVTRVVLSDFRQIIGLSLIDPNIVEKVVGAGAKMRLGPEMNTAFDAAFSTFDDIPELGGPSIVLSAEKTINLQPDLVIISDQRSPATDALVDQLDRAGIPAIYIDYRVNPYENTIPSLRIAGLALGQVDMAEDFIGFYVEHWRNVTDRVAGLTNRPNVLMHLQATPGAQCCMSLSASNLGQFITAAGGHNIGEDIIPGAMAQIAPEYILALQPDVYIGTGGRQLEADGGIVTGPGVPYDLAVKSLEGMRNAPIIRELSVTQTQRFHGIWHNFHNSPLNIVALEVLAKWLHPDDFADLDPQATLTEINTRFLPITIEGTPWVSVVNTQ